MLGSLLNKKFFFCRLLNKKFFFFFFGNTIKQKVGKMSSMKKKFTIFLSYVKTEWGRTIQIGFRRRHFSNWPCIHSQDSLTWLVPLWVLSLPLIQSSTCLLWHIDSNQPSNKWCKWEGMVVDLVDAFPQSTLTHFPTSI